MSFAVDNIDGIFLDALEDVVLLPTFINRVTSCVRVVRTRGDTRGHKPSHVMRDAKYVPKWVAAAQPEGLTVGLIQSVASPTGNTPVAADFALGGPLIPRA